MSDLKNTLATIAAVLVVVLEIIAVVLEVDIDNKATVLIKQAHEDSR